MFSHLRKLWAIYLLVSIDPQIRRRVFVVGMPFHTPDRALPFQGQERQCDQPGVEQNPYG
jgi:hypothetical protein